MFLSSINNFLILDKSLKCSPVAEVSLADDDDEDDDDEDDEDDDFLVVGGAVCAVVSMSERARSQMLSLVEVVSMRSRRACSSVLFAALLAPFLTFLSASNLPLSSLAREMASSRAFTSLERLASNFSSHARVNTARASSSGSGAFMSPKALIPIPPAPAEPLTRLTGSSNEMEDVAAADSKDGDEAVMEASGSE